MVFLVPYGSRSRCSRRHVDEPGHMSVLRGCPRLTLGSFTQQGRTKVCCISTENQTASLAWQVLEEETSHRGACVDTRSPHLGSLSSAFGAWDSSRPHGMSMHGDFGSLSFYKGKGK